MSLSAFDINDQLSDLVETALTNGPQVVSKDGVETAVLISFDEWKRLQTGANPVTSKRRSLKDILLDPNGPRDLIVPPRGKHKHRPPIEFE